MSSLYSQTVWAQLWRSARKYDSSRPGFHGHSRFFILFIFFSDCTRRRKIMNTIEKRTDNAQRSLGQQQVRQHSTLDQRPETKRRRAGRDVA